MKRKSYDPKKADMKTVVPIHNAVNERAWKEIKEWEAGRGSEKYVILYPSLPCDAAISAIIARECRADWSSSCI